MSLRDFKQTLLQVRAAAAPSSPSKHEEQKLAKSSPNRPILSVSDPYSVLPPSSSESGKPSIRPHKRIKLSDYASLLSLSHGPTEIQPGRQHPEQEEQRVDHGHREAPEPQLEEEDRDFSTREGTHELQKRSEGDISGDSEAGLFIQSQSEGLQEPLILSTPIAEGAGNMQVPSSINSRLMEHQREGVKFLYGLYRENKGGVLGDDMGLGKTIQVIAFLAAILESNDQQILKNVNSCHKMYNKHVLIICPTSVLRNWEQEIHAWSTFDVAIYHGIHRETVFSRLESGNLQIVLTSFDTFRLHGNCLLPMDWDCIVVDEAHRLKNEKSDLYKACTQLRTKRRYGLTGTIMQNKLMDLFNVFDWAVPGCLGAREHFKEFYEEPLKQGQRISAPERFVQIANERRLHLAKVLKKCLLRREKSDTIGHLMMGKEDNVIFCEMSPLQRKVYKRLLASPDFQCLVRKDDLCSCGGPLTHAECCHRTVPNGIIWSYLHKENVDGCDSCPYCMILPCLVKLQQVSNHLELIKPNPKDELEKQKKDEMLAELVLGEEADLVGGTSQHENFLGLSDSQHCGKMRALEILLAQWLKEGDKVLLFSYSVRMLDILDKFLIRKGYCFSRLDGSTAMSMRQSLVDEFNRSPSKQVFLISTRAGGLGLNLVSANRVVIFDPNWNPAQDLQAQDRSFRYGQKRHVTVYRLLAAGSLEELVYTRQIYKQQLFNIAVSGNLEKRYFEGVQDSKDYKGELFGISNLFRDLSEEAFTSEIIEKHEKRKLRYVVDERRTKVRSQSSIEARMGPSVKHGLHDKMASSLRNAGVVYAHRNEEVVNCRSKCKVDDVLSSSIKQISERSNIASLVTCGIVKEDDSSARKIPREGKVRSFRMSKEEQFASLANFKGMDQTQFSNWLLTASEHEKEELLFNFKQRRMAT